METDERGKNRYHVPPLSHRTGAFMNVCNRCKNQEQDVEDECHQARGQGQEPAVGYHAAYRHKQPAAKQPDRTHQASLDQMRHVLPVIISHPVSNENAGCCGEQ